MPSEARLSAARSSSMFAATPQAPPGPTAPEALAAAASMSNLMSREVEAIVAEASRPSKVAAKLRAETFTTLGDAANRHHEGGLEERKVAGRDGRFYRSG